ncbi:MAG: hypothetical protein EXR04_07900 [Rhodospirillales bacterium]|nr:hypothetical protein [Rhodospirillales bacterium]
MRDAILSGLRGGGVAAWAALPILPAVFVVAAIALRQAGGAFWEWHIADPSYFYLFDSLHIARLTPPGQSFHPGTPVQIIGALVLKATYPLSSGAELAARVFDDPEAHLRLIGNVLLGLNALALLLAGWAVRALGGSLPLALLMQAGPFLSMVILKNAYHVKPESLLIAVALALSVLVLAAGRAWGRDGVTPLGVHSHDARRLALAFGAVAGFGVATKLTAAPVFLLPLFLLGGPRGIAVYALAAAAAFVVFTAPALPNFGRVLDYTVAVLARSGAYGSGSEFVVDMAVYPRAVVSVASRPVVHLQLLMGAIALAIWAWRSRQGLRVPAFELRALAGIALAIFAAVLAVAKQPTANYMVPAYMLAPLSVILFYRFVAGLGWGDAVWRRRAAAAVAVLFAAVAVAQTFAVRRQYVELEGKRAEARMIDNDRFAACARIYSFPASSSSFALFLGDWWTGGREGAAVASRVPANDLWFEQNTMKLRDAYGPRDLGRVLAENRCVFLRGGHPGPIGDFLASHAPGVRFDRACSSREETVLTRGVDCAGRPIRTNN